MRDRVDSVLKKLRFRGKPLSVNRLTWWIVIILTRLFGREVDLGDGQKHRIFPIVWGGKVHLLGVERHIVNAAFTSEYTLRLRTRPPIGLSAGDVVPLAAPSTPTAVHVVLGHILPKPMDRILEYSQELAGSSSKVVLAYGGTKENFEQIRFLHKVFIDDPTLRGVAFRMTYFVLMGAVRAYLDQIGLDPEWIFIADYDLLPTQPDYLEGLISLMRTHGAGLGGKQFDDVSLTNKLFVTQALEAGVFDRRKDLNGPGKKPLYHGLGCGFLFHRDCYQAVLHEKTGLESVLFELTVPTAAALHGYRLLAFDAFTTYFKHVRYRPIFTSDEALHVAESGAEFVHPLKDSDAFIEAWSVRRMQNVLPSGKGD